MGVDEQLVLVSAVLARNGLTPSSVGASQVGDPPAGASGVESRQAGSSLVSPTVKQQVRGGGSRKGRLALA